MNKAQKLLTTTILMFALATIALGGTITGSKTGSSISRSGTITGSRTGTITGSRTGIITGSRAGETATVNMSSSAISSIRENFTSRLVLLMINLPW